MSEADRIAEILGEWLRSREGGEAPEPEEIVAAHPDLADELRARFAAVALADQVLAPGRSPAEAPRRIGEYRIVREVGRGGMGVVYEAEQTSMRRRVALKVLFPSALLSPRAVKRFRQEAWAAGRLKHTNIVAVHQLGQDRGVWYCAMELVDGRSLAEVIEDLRRERGRPREGGRPRESGLARRALARGPPAGGAAAKDAGSGTAPGRDASSGGSALAHGTTTGSRAYYLRVAEMFAGVADALQVAHEHGVIHRDVKPGNLLLDGDGNLKLLDFGLARLEGTASAMTMTGEMLGTPLYMSPEQLAEGREPVDHRTDVYSLGATLYEALVLRPPFQGRDVATIMGRILRDDPVPPRRLDAHVPRDLETIVSKALEKEPARRYRTAAEMARDLRLFAEGGAIRARRIGLPERAWRKVRRHPARSALVAGLVVAVAVAGALWVDSRRGRERLAEAERRRLELQYAALCAQAEQAAARELTGEDDSQKRSRELFDRAISLMPDRPEAYLGRSRVSVRTVDLNDLGAAAERGAPPRVVHLMRAWLAESKGNDAEAEAEHRLADEHPSDDSYAFVLEGVMASVRGDRPKALALFTEALARAPVGSTASYLAHWHRCLAHEENGEDAKALADLHVLEGMGDRSAHLRIRIAGLWRRLGREKEAQALFDELHSAARTVEALRDLAFACDICGERTWQEQVARDGLALAPDDVGFLLKLAKASHKLRGPEEALGNCERILAIDPKNHAAQCQKVSMLIELRRCEEALDLAPAAAESDPSCAFVPANQAEALLKLSRPQEALSFCRRALEIDPRLPLALLNLARALIKVGEPGEALEAADLALVQQPRDAATHKERAVALMFLGRHEEAIEAIDAAVRLAPEQYGLHMERGRMLEAAGRAEGAKEAFERALGCPDTTSRDRAYLLLLLGRNEEAVQGYVAALEETPQDPSAHANLAFLLARQGRPGEAVPHLRRAIELRPDWFLVRFNLTHMVFATQQWQDLPAAVDDAMALVERGAVAWGEVSYEPEVVLLDLHRFKAAALGCLGDHAGAEASFRRALDLGTKEPGLFLDAAISAFKQGKNAEALSLLERAAQEGVESAPLCNYHGCLLSEAGRWAEALTRFERARELDPAFPKALFNRANALALGREEDAIAAYKEALERYPDEPGGVAGFAWLLATAREEELRDVTKAVALARRAVALDEKNPVCRNALGVALCRAGKWEEALEALHDLGEPSDDGEAAASFFAAIAEHRLGRTEEARASYERAKAWMDEKKPDDEELKRFRAEAAAALGVD